MGSIFIFPIVTVLYGLSVFLGGLRFCLSIQLLGILLLRKPEYVNFVPSSKGPVRIMQSGDVRQILKFFFTSELSPSQAHCEHRAHSIILSRAGCSV